MYLYLALLLIFFTLIQYIKAMEQNDQTNSSMNDFTIINDPESIFKTESESHDSLFNNPKKTGNPQNKTICLDIPFVSSFKGLVNVPQKLSHRKKKDFLNSRLNLEMEIDSIGLHEPDFFDADLLTEEINELHNYLIPKSQKEINEATQIKDATKLQCEILTNAKQSHHKSNLIDLSTIKNTFRQTNDATQIEGLKITMRKICHHYNDQTFDVNETISLLSTL
ncbi:hypothetical protein TRFO_25578 [Tritrichomonas foetus]|uniref:Uncharacterized protein n=1 Tax=Tritrichomonas foetus TaxID=1144522 RepID=A0A1J4K4F0_9EUKA|nr:hypothetical protein TRFO_25578 [Tritrichomonas foetus]|eukprot:OHT06321.1 hypothetical protein TRFO_25578 [Tritrichomonas foetus]